jgi:alpha-D-xyloside xylohydrolase
MTSRSRLILALLPWLTGAATAAWSAPAATVEKAPQGVFLQMDGGTLGVSICAENIVRVAFAKDRAFFDRTTLATAQRQCTSPPWQLTEEPTAATLSTARLKVRVDLGNGAVTFLDAKGQTILAEQPAGRRLEPAVVQGDETFHVRQQWLPEEGEALYGLGQHQLGLMDIKGYDLDLWQHNATIIVPFLASSRGYGILWDNASYTRFGDLRPFVAIPAEQLHDATGQPGGLTGTYFAGAAFDREVGQRVDDTIDIAIPSGTRQANRRIFPGLPPEGPISVRWEGTIVPQVTGDHLIQAFSNGGIKMWVDGHLIADHWRQGWLPWIDLAKVHLEAGRAHPVRIEWTKDQGMETMRLSWKTPAASRATSLWSEVGEGTDYTFIYGPDLDTVVAGYRSVTGQAPMMPRWAFGLWQSRQRYETAQQSLDVVKGFRSRQIPFDTIVQDWFYWKEDAWGSHEFDPARFPDPAAWVKAIHDLNAHLMISVWGKFYPGTANFEAMRSHGYLYESLLGAEFKDWVGPGYPYSFFDAFNPEARKLFWKQIKTSLFSIGIDAWWMDASEPDITPTPTLAGQRQYMHPTAMGTGARMLNGWSIVNSEGIYDGWREAAPNRRAFILTRSGFAGQQRYAAASWSGDVTSTWTAMRKQIAAGLGLSISGIPYWTMDIGGFAVPARFSRRDPTPEDLEEWRELNVRWFQFGTFVPLLRVHGEYPHREMWELGGESSPAYKTELTFDRLRYRLLPYVYTLAGDVTQKGGTIMRPLAMDFPHDKGALDIADEFMFGPAFLVSPVTTYQARSRSVYLPTTPGGWYDFWTGRTVEGGQRIDAPAPYDALPVHVRAGSIVPFGPELQYAVEKPADPITLFIYAGADGALDLYEDDGSTYEYERGAMTRIPMRWEDSTRRLHIGDRQGSFPGMLASRTFEVVLVTPTKAAGFSFAPQADTNAFYNGIAMDVKLP